MELTDLATKDYTFQQDPYIPRHGLLTCRHCHRNVVIEIRMTNFLFFTSSKVKVFGNWCNCSNIEGIIRALIGESIGIEQKFESTSK